MKIVLNIVVSEFENSEWFVCGILLFFINLVWVVIVISVLVVLKKLMKKNVKIIMSICGVKIFGKWIIVWLNVDFIFGIDEIIWVGILISLNNILVIVVVVILKKIVFF